MLYDMRSAHFLPLCAREDGFDPQWHLHAFEIEEDGCEIGKIGRRSFVSKD